MSLPKLVVFESKMVSGVRKFEEGDPVDSHGNLVQFVPLREARAAFEQRWPTDAHCVLYGADDETHMPRILKGSLAELVERGLRLRMRWVLIDIDNLDHVPWEGDPNEVFEALLSELKTKLGPMFEAAGVYMTKHGYRIIWALEEGLLPAEYEPLLRGLLHHLRSLGVLADLSCADWTRFMRMPRVTRDGVVQDYPMRLNGLRPCDPFRGIEPKEKEQAKRRATTSKTGREGGASSMAELDGRARTHIAKAIGQLSETGPGQGRHTAIFAAACELGRILAGGHITEALAISLIVEASRKCGKGACEGGPCGKETCSVQICSDVHRQIASGFSKGAMDPRIYEMKHGLPVLFVREEASVVDEALWAASHQHELYDRGGVLVELRRPLSEAEELTSFHIIGALRMQRLICSAATWRRRTGKDKDGNAKPHALALPPSSVGAQIVQAPAWHGIGRARTLIYAPTVKADGALLCESGFDEESGILCEIPKHLKVGVPDSPSRGDALIALAELKDILADFPFEKAGHETAAVCAMMTALLRATIAEPAPLFLITSSKRGSGKSLLADLVALVATGKGAPRDRLGARKEEREKTLVSLAQAGRTLVCFDNIKSLGGEALDAVLTSSSGTAYSGRILGTNKMSKAVLQATWLATGNNPVMGGDISRRLLPIRLVPRVEHPDRRTGFRHGPTNQLKAYVLRNRAKLIAAALTIARAFIIADPDLKAQAMGSFEEWSGRVRLPLMWLGCEDPLLTRTDAEEDPAEVAKARLVAALWALREEDPAKWAVWSTRKVGHLIKSRVPQQQPSAAEEDLYSALEELDIIDDRKGFKGRAFGYLLRELKQSIFDGKMLEQAADSGSKRSLWTIKAITS